MAAKSFTASSSWASTSPSLSARSLFLTVTPTPPTMSARSSILRAISAHGPVDHFRCLKHHPTSPQPNAFHTIVSTKESADRLLKSSPFSVGADGRRTPTYADEIEQNSGDEETYTIEVHHSYHAPELAIKSSPLYGSWKSSLLKNGVATNPIAVNLAARIPSSIAKEGIVDWSRDSPRERRAWFTGEGTEDGTPWRIQRRLREEAMAGIGRRRGGGSVRRSVPEPVEEENWEVEDEHRAEEEVLPFDNFDGGVKPQKISADMDPDMQRALHQVRDRFGPSSETLERTAHEAEAERVEAERIAAIRAAAMERTRSKFGSLRPPQTLQEATLDAAAGEQAASLSSAAPARQVSPAKQTSQEDLEALEKARKAMREKKERYAAWAKGKEESGQSLKDKSKSEKWKMFWDEVEHKRTLQE